MRLCYLSPMPSLGRLGLSYSPALVLGVALCAACGLRTDPASGGLICVEGDQGETGEPEVGSCENPIPMEVVDGQIARGTISGCSESDGFCDANGGEQVFKMVWPGANDVTLNFIPAETDINPVMRVVEVPSGEEAPCGEGVEMQEELVCGAIVTDIPGRSFYTRGGYDYYVIVDSRSGEAGDYAFQVKTGWQETGSACIDNAEPEAIVLGVGGVYNWTSQLQEGAGRIGGGGACNAPGDEDVFLLQILDSGTLHVAVQSTSGGPAPVAAVRTGGCGGANQIACAEAEVDQFFTQLDFFMEGPVNRYLVIDNPGGEANSYTFEAWFD